MLLVLLWLSGGRAWSPSSTRLYGPRQSVDPKNSRTANRQSAASNLSNVRSSTTKPSPRVDPHTLGATVRDEDYDGDTTLYDQRTVKLAAAVQAGQSRWGSMENQRVTMLVQGQTSAADGMAEHTAAGTTTTNTAQDPHFYYRQRIANVAAAAQAGKSRWGRMENERATVLAKGSSHAVPSNAAAVPPQQAAAPPPPRPKAVPTTRPASPSTNNNHNDVSLYQKRSQQVARAAAAGQSRWGSMHVEKVATATGLQQALTTLADGVPDAPPPPPPTTTLVSAPIPVTPRPRSLYDQRNARIVAMGPSLSRWGPMEQEQVRMSWGLREALHVVGQGVVEALSATSVQPKGSSSSSSSSSNTALYDSRAQTVAAAAAAGKSRWGTMHVEKVTAAAQPVPESTLYEQRNERLAAAATAGASRWGTMENEKAAMAAGLKQAFDFLGGPPPAEEKASGKMPASASPPPPKAQVVSNPPPKPSSSSSSSSDDIMAQLAREWSSMNKDVDRSSARSSVAAVPSAPVVAPPPPASTTSSADVTMDQLAREWAALNSDHESSGRRGTTGTSWAAPAPAVAQPVRPAFPAVPPKPVRMPPPPVAAAVSAGREAAPARVVVENDWERLAQEWMQTNADKDA